MLTKNQKRIEVERLKDIHYTTPGLKLLKKHNWGFSLRVNNEPLECIDPITGHKHSFKRAVLIQKDRNDRWQSTT